MLYPSNYPILTWLIVMSRLGTVVGPPTTQKETRWVCESEIAKYTNSECEVKGDVEGCYHLTHHKLYRSCASICNDVIQHSIDEERCDSECPGYYSVHGKCSLVSEVETTSSLPLPAGSGSSPRVGASSQQGSSGQLIGAVIGGIVGVVVIAAAAILAYCYRKRKGNKKKADSSTNGVVGTDADQERLLVNGGVEMRQENTVPVTNPVQATDPDDQTATEIIAQPTNSVPPDSLDHQSEYPEHQPSENPTGHEDTHLDGSYPPEDVNQTVPTAVDGGTLDATMTGADSSAGAEGQEVNIPEGEQAAASEKRPAGRLDQLKNKVRDDVSSIGTSSHTNSSSSLPINVTENSIVGEPIEEPARPQRTINRPINIQPIAIRNEDSPEPVSPSSECSLFVDLHSEDDSS